MNNEKIGTFISKLRKEKKLTQKDLANKLNITDRAVSKWERGICLPDISLLSNLSEILDVSVIELLNGEKDSKKRNSKDILNTLDYAAKKNKEDIKKVINIVMLSLLLFISIYLILQTLKNDYYFNYKYPYTAINIFIDNEEQYSKNSDIISLVEEKINIINNNQGKYINSDYKVIKEYTNLLSSITNFKIEKQMLANSYFTYQDMYYLVNNNSSNNTYLGFDTSEVEKIIQKYKKDYVIEKSNIYVQTYYSYYEYVSDFIKKIYSTDNMNDDLMGFKCNYLLTSKYNFYKEILNKIIEVGDIHE